jgi:hypothetical protein
MKTRFQAICLLVLMITLFVSHPLKTLADTSTSVSEGISYTHWQDLPAGKLKTEFSETGSMLINHLNLVGVESGKPVLIGGGGFTEANLNWLIQEMGVRTIIDLRGKFSDDKTNQLIALSPATLNDYKQKHQLNALKNLSPDEVKQYVEKLRQTDHISVQYLHLRAEDPHLMDILNQANSHEPVAMFCQWGVNRSGTAWGAYAAQKGWSLDKALQAFGVSKPGGGYLNRRDIEYGYHLR